MTEVLSESFLLRFFFISGGWLLVLNVVTDSSATLPWLSTVTSYRGISGFHSNKMVSTKSAMNELRTHLPFTQLRFYCSKRQGRTFHVVTTANSSGEAVVQFFSGQTDVMPDSCGSFVRMENDNSMLAQVCDQWGKLKNGSDNIGKWSNGDFGADSEERLYNHAVSVTNTYYWLLGRIDDSRWECDDYNRGVKPGDFWKVFVR